MVLNLPTPDAASTPVTGHKVLRSLLLILCLTIVCSGCARFRHDQHDTVYVNVQKKFLRDRVAAVSNRVCEVQNGQRLEVLEHWRRFVKVKTQDNQIGWIEEAAVIDSQEYQGFADLTSQHGQDPVVATGIVRDDSTLHLLPGRDTAHFYFLAINTKVQLLVRASVLKNKATTKPPVPAAQPPAKPAAQPQAGQPGAVDPPPPPPLEDWWLVRDGEGHIGWLMGSRIDVEVPDEIGVYAEGQRIVGAYILKKVTDPEASTPNHEVAEWVTVLGPPKSGLPYDFDQVRVFTWSLKRHRYETSFRLKPIQGFFPVKVAVQDGTPLFSVRVGDGSTLTADAKTGQWKPASMRTINYALVDTTVKRVGPDMAPIPTMHLAESNPAAGKGKSKTKK